MNNASRYRKLLQLAVNNEGFIFEPQTGGSFTVNATGHEILTKLMTNENEEDIAKYIAELYSLTLQNAQSDIRDFLEQLRAYHLI